MSFKALGLVVLEVEGVLEGVGVLSDSSESLSNWDFPRHILNTIGGFVGSLFLLLFTFELNTVFSVVVLLLLLLLLDEKNFRGEDALVVLK